MLIKTIRFALFACVALACTPSFSQTAPSASKSHWDGFQIGIDGRLLSSLSDWQTTYTGAGFFRSPATRAGNPAEFRRMAPQLGAFIGYNRYISEKLLLGVEIDGFATLNGKKALYGIPGTFTGSYPAGSNDRTTYRAGPFSGSIRARLGSVMLQPDLLFYTTAGLAFREDRYRVDCYLATPGWCVADRHERTRMLRFGPTVGAGFEKKITEAISIRLDYRFTAFAERKHAFFANAPIDTVFMKTTPITHSLGLGVGYRF